ncbi:UvrD-helicase domain-containing protein [Pararcticibacter amylolyticus]|uniref:DNA 3'-5' helicase II n=1 Tax=Pararcticibacter amylolyticus TaxID=2173175 RepID=A0A2U2PHP1_9SPHI|nr:UvrD-helicase domain-containing protein [Pararcticibacter amylolyticus]PWG80659.1 hypothetical protein DDR33_11600 [Pararcticibacter amylolyticus]
MTTGTNNLIVAAAGSGKTTHLVKEALKVKGKRVLITTFTEANEQEIRNKIVELNHCIPPNITVQTWFSFLLQHGVRPFQGCLLEKRINGLLLVSGQSGKKGEDRFGKPIYFSEKEFERHYFTPGMKVYSDKLAKFVVRCNERSDGAVIERLTNIYTNIFIDEVQDLAGYDLEFLKLLFNCKAEILLVGDPRQGTYSTANAAKNKQFKKSEIVHFFEDHSLGLTTDDTSLMVNHRCIKAICDLSNSLFPDFKPTSSGNFTVTGHDGLFFIRPADVAGYLAKYRPIQLRDKVTQAVDQQYEVMNFGESKGLSFERVLIYPTQPILDWLKSRSTVLAPTSRSKFYVALTRARSSVAVIFDFNDKTEYSSFTKYTPS